jgi:hypothetical protein
MKKLPKKLKLAKETILQLETKSLGDVVGATRADTNCGSACLTNCLGSACHTC